MAGSTNGEYLDTSAELTFETIKKKTIKGIVTLTGRTFFLQVVALVATFFLTVFLDPIQYGVFFIVSSIINFFAYFSDIGLAAALVQKKEKLSQEDLKTTFSVQQFLVIILIIIILGLTPFIKSWYDMTQASVYLLWALAFSLFLSSLKTIPSVMLERKLEFGKLILPQIVETLLFNLVAVVLAWKGFGITSFTVAVLVRGLAGLTIIYILQPWTPGFLISRKSLHALFRFGIPYQINTFLAVIKDDGMTILLGGILGSSAMGLLGWAQRWASAPLRFFMDQVIRVTFPTFSRLQDDKEGLSKVATKSIFFICLAVFPAVVILLTIAPILTDIIPKYEKWKPAIFVLSILTINTMWAAVTTPLTNLLNAIGKITVTFRLMIMWTILTWLILPPLSIQYGINGVAFGFALIGSSSIVAIMVTSRYVKIDFIYSVFKSLISAIVMLMIIEGMKYYVGSSLLTMMLLIIVGLTVYSAMILLLVGFSIIEDGKKFILAFKKIGTTEE